MDSLDEQAHPRITPPIGPAVLVAGTATVTEPVEVAFDPAVMLSNTQCRAT
ncbi:hypothetical protein [Nocardia sp. NRRL S-836]|uniref:hypothetical protein n=1 Tax=Nocardia sp. NRRL S-836 TaxID=1519492 RepID=UPI0012F79AC6|nr:hypothetical protein [Nocardia sp. NRRL S-836]